MSIKDGGPAYPHRAKASSRDGHGMTMRQFYKEGAIRALVGDPNLDLRPEDLIAMAARYADLAIAEDAKHEQEHKD